jgi:hypothetical protein
VSTSIEFDEFIWIWNRSQGLTTPQLHLGIARWLSKHGTDGHRELVLLAFRNSGKSTVVGLYCAWLLCRDPNVRILVLAGDFSLAKKMVRNIKQVIERHPVTRGLRPIRSDQWASDQFTVCRSAALRDPSVLAKGISSNITGLRADAIICDDVEVPNTCDTPAKRSDLRSRLSEIEYILVPDGLKLFVGTPHAQDSIYNSVNAKVASKIPPFLSGYKRLELPLLDDMGRSRWPERFPDHAIEGIRTRTSSAKFESQMMLRPRNFGDARLDSELIDFYDDELLYTETCGQARLSLNGRRLVSASCWWDPSFGTPEKGDSSVIAVVFSSEDGFYWLHRIAYLKHNPEILGEVDAATQLCRQVVAFAAEFYVPSVTIETNGLGRFLPGLLRVELRNQNESCAVIEHTSRQQKDLRIIDGFEAILAAQRLRAHSSVLKTPFLSEMNEWRPGAHAADDGLDAVAGCLSSQPVRLPRILKGLESAPGRKSWRYGSDILVADTDFAL